VGRKNVELRGDFWGEGGRAIGKKNSAEEWRSVANKQHTGERYQEKEKTEQLRKCIGIVKPTETERERLRTTTSANWKNKNQEDKGVEGQQTKEKKMMIEKRDTPVP